MSKRLDGADFLTKQQRAECNVVELRLGIGIGRRDEALKLMGFNSYHDYLKSDLWKAIRTIALRDDPSCCVCSNTASQAHHLNYSIDALEGKLSAIKASIVPMCEKCHRKVHFKGSQFLVCRGARRRLRKLMGK